MSWTVRTIYFLLTTCQHLSKSPNWTTLHQPRSWTIWNPCLHGMEFQKLSSPTMVRSTRHRRSVRSLMLMDSLTEQAVRDTHNQTEFLKELWRQSRVSWRRARTSLKHFSRTGELRWATATVQLSYWWGGSFERPFRLYHHRWLHSGHICKMQGRHSVTISSARRKRLINVTEWSTWNLWNQVNMSGWRTWIVEAQWRRICRRCHDRTWWRRNTVMSDAIVVT